MIKKLTGVKGMNDVLPQQAALWQTFEQAAQSVLCAYGYRHIRTPIVEYTSLFTRSIGTMTDIVEKEMYSFTDALNGEHLTLRPENTAAIVRSAIEHNLLYDGPKRLWYSGPMFRHERPQRGRYRQFHQLGVEALGFAGPDIDAEIILLGQRLWHNLGLAEIRLEINSLGQAHERAAYRDALITYFEQHIDQFDDDAKRRLYTNPLRVLDTKYPPLQAVVQQAPALTDFLGDASRAHFDQLQSLLSANHIQFKINPRLVRGLDYYNLTVFEWIADQLGAQNAVAGGGRYDLLVEQLGGKPTPACGWAIGIERILTLMQQDQHTPALKPAGCDVYLVHHGQAAYIHAFVIAERLRDAGFDTILHCSAEGTTGAAGASASFKSQMKRANASGATYAVIIGEDEIAQNVVSVKPLHGEGVGGYGDRNASTQQQVSVESLTQHLQALRKYFPARG